MRPAPVNDLFHGLFEWHTQPGTTASARLVVSRTASSPRGYVSFVSDRRLAFTSSVPPHSGLDLVEPLQGDEIHTVVALQPGMRREPSGGAIV